MFRGSLCLRQALAGAAIFGFIMYRKRRTRLPKDAPTAAYVRTQSSQAEEAPMGRIGGATHAQHASYGGVVHKPATEGAADDGEFEAPLPANWVASESETGHIYYYNSVTGTSQVCERAAAVTCFLHALTQVRARQWDRPTA
jgi:hypothetical protein